MTLNIFGALGPVLDELFLGVLVIDRDGRIVYYNRHMGELDELTPEETLGYRISEVYSVRDEDSPTMTALNTRQPIKGLYMHYQTARGRRISTLNHAFPLFHQGELIGAVCIVTDVSSLARMVMPPVLADRQGAPAEEPAPRARFDRLVGKNPVFREAVDVAKVAAVGPSPVMLVGETGTGKDLFAQAIHEYSDRANQPFTAINCAAIPEALLEGMLFGTARGAFTGAVDKVGLLEHASGGTVFLDEITSMPLALQAKLLRVLQDQRVRRVGGLSEKKVDIRIISAANVSPLKAVADNHLRADLYYRLGVIQVRIPPLRERPEDIPHLVNRFIKTVSARLGKAVTGVSPEVLALWKRQPWPGNVRELEHTVESVLNFVADGEQLTTRHLKRVSRHHDKAVAAPAAVFRPPRADELRWPASPPDHMVPPSSGPQLRRDLDSVERDRLAAALRASGGRVNRAAAALGLSPQLMSYKMKKHALNRLDFLP